MADIFKGLPVFSVLVPVFCKESLEYTALLVFGTVSAGVQFFLHEAAAFHGAAGSADIPAAIAISEPAAFAGGIFQGRACTAVSAAAADIPARIFGACSGLFRHIQDTLPAGYFMVVP